MPVGEIVSEVLGGVLRVIGRCLVEIFFELLVKGVGYALVKAFRPRSDPEEAVCAVVGLAFWVAAIATAVFVHGRFFVT